MEKLNIYSNTSPINDNEDIEIKNNIKKRKLINDIYKKPFSINSYMSLISITDIIDNKKH